MQAVTPASLLARHRALRWLAPAGVLGIAGLAASSVFTSTAASRSLPKTSPASLIAQVQTSGSAGFSGTVVSTFALGLPDLPSLGGVGGASSLASLLVGSHTMQVWYGGVDQQRVALLGTTDETDVFRNGRDLWQWSSSDRTAVHTTLPALGSSLPSTIASSTPEQLAHSMLAKLDSTTSVRVEHDHDVADRSSYELVLTPRSTTTLVGTVHIAVDGRTKVPLGVQVYARGADSPAIDVGYTSIRFARPSGRNFAFTPPPGAHVRAVAAQPLGQHTAADRSVQVIGSGWSSVGVTRLPPAELDSDMARGLLAQARSVSGSWGRGRLMQTPLASVLIADDGRVLVGSVEPSVLYAAAATK